MTHFFQSLSIAVIFSIILGSCAVSQQAQTDVDKDVAYTKVVNARADKIVLTLGIADSTKAIKVRDIIAGQYQNLNTIHEAQKEALQVVKESEKLNREALAEKTKKLEDDVNTKLAKLHKKYLKNLSKELTPEQVDMVKDGMTYRVLPITYKGYQEMLPNLTAGQKRQILAYLTEAREHAMDAGSSEKKHAWFGKYKGRINNYLSAAGIDMNKASKEWQQRIKAENEAKKSQ